MSEAPLQVRFAVLLERCPRDVYLHLTRVELLSGQRDRGDESEMRTRPRVIVGACEVLSERERECVKESERDSVTCWVCGATPSALERERSRARSTGEPKYRGTSLLRKCPPP